MLSSSINKLPLNRMRPPGLRLIISFFIFHFSSLPSFSQAPTLDWQNTVGGSGDDILQTSCKTTDGGMLLGGGSGSGISGDKTEGAFGSWDMWLVKLDSTGAIQWQNTIGGVADDFVYSVQQTLDGGYIVAGYSNSGISGDKTEPNIGSYDFWVLKLDASGNIVWQNTIGGTLNDQATCIRQTSDLGYIVVGFSCSNATGDKTEMNQGPTTTTDYWVLKLDASGNIVWQNSIGGNYYDYIYAVEQTWEGGYLIGGYSQSGISGDKTEALIGASDYWVIKLNASGGIQWQNTIGGTSSESLRRILLAPDGGYILAGYSSSDISGDKTENAWGTGSDYWVVKINTSGSIVWQNDIGGTGDDLLFGATVTTDGGYALTGVTYSGLSGEKTENSMGGSDAWVVKLSSTGVLEWQNTIGGTSDDAGISINQYADASFSLGCYSKSGISGDKTEGNMGPASTYDYWAIGTLGACIPSTEICNAFDDNCNGLIDDGINETISITPDNATTFCQGGSVNLIAIHSGAEVQWKRNGVNIDGETDDTLFVTSKGTYTCMTISACDSTESSSISVIVNKNPSASITPGGATTFCAGGSVTLTEAPVAGCSYQWYKGAAPLTGATTTTYVATTTGNYKCRVTKIATGCYKNSNIIAVSVPCRDGEIYNDQEIEIYPNPASEIIIITAPFENYAYAILDLNGNILMQVDATAAITECAIHDLPAGMYFIRILSDNYIATKNFIKQ